MTNTVPGQDSSPSGDSQPSTLPWSSSLRPQLWSALRPLLPLVSSFLSLGFMTCFKFPMALTSIPVLTAPPSLLIIEFPPAQPSALILTSDCSFCLTCFVNFYILGGKKSLLPFFSPRLHPGSAKQPHWLRSKVHPLILLEKDELAL